MLDNKSALLEQYRAKHPEVNDGSDAEDDVEGAVDRLDAAGALSSEGKPADGERVFNHLRRRAMTRGLKWPYHWPHSAAA